MVVSSNTSFSRWTGRSCVERSISHQNCVIISCGGNILDKPLHSRYTGCFSQYVCCSQFHFQFIKICIWVLFITTLIMQGMYYPKWDSAYFSVQEWCSPCMVNPTEHTIIKARTDNKYLNFTPFLLVLTINSWLTNCKL